MSTPPAVALLARVRRLHARMAGQWPDAAVVAARADALRSELQAEGWIVEDGPDGTTIRK